MIGNLTYNNHQFLYYNIISAFLTGFIESGETSGNTMVWVFVINQEEGIHHEDHNQKHIIHFQFKRPFDSKKN